MESLASISRCSTGLAALILDTLDCSALDVRTRGRGLLSSASRPAMMAAITIFATSPMCLRKRLRLNHERRHG
jgi:hypothetical protein